MQIAQFVLIGVGAGVLSGMFGIGGGLVIVPFLAFVVGMQLPLAIGTSLGALLLPVGILGVIEFFKNGNLDIRAALIIAAGLFIGTFFWGKNRHRSITSGAPTDLCTFSGGDGGSVMGGALRIISKSRIEGRRL